MDNEIFDNIINLLKNYNNPGTGKLYDTDSDINLVVKNGHANISILIIPEKIKVFESDKNSLQKKILSLPNVLSANIIFTSEKKIDSIDKKKPNLNKFNIDAENIIAIASGKGGVGKSTVSVNLSIALSKLGKSVALLDADIYGPSIPKMMGISDKPNSNENKKFIPLENYGIKCMSIGFLIPSDAPTIWRGPMIMKALEQLFINVEWGKIDYLIVDLPPGTGDTQITMAQRVPLKGAIIVSTPQDIALIDARKGINMFKKVEVPVLGLIENMSYFICDNCNERHEIFSHGGAKKEAADLGVKFLGEIPLVTALRVSSDNGKPIGIYEPKSKIADSYLQIAKRITI